jgi:predicted MFS family arabinose efflux permease
VRAWEAASAPSAHIQEELSSFAAAMAGGVIAFYQLGYGIAAFGIGPLVDSGVSLSTIYASSAVIALCMGAWSFVVAHRRPSPASLHPQLGSQVMLATPVYLPAEGRRHFPSDSRL